MKTAVFMGSPAMALPSLRVLAAHPGLTLAGVVTQPDRPAGRNRRLQACPAKSAAQGMGLVGRTESFKHGAMYFASDLADNLARGDDNYLSLLDEADAYITRNGLDLPEEPEARIIEADPQCVTDPVLELNLAEAGITSIIWATGFATDFSWLMVDALDEQGKPKHQRGISAEPGIYFLGLPWQSRRGSSFIWGVWHDARFLADQISIQRQYLAYNTSTQRESESA